VGIGRTAEILEWEEGYVVKLFFTGVSREVAEREAKAGRLISELGLPVPAVREVVEVAGRYGIVFEHMGNGRTMLQEFGSKPWRLSSLMRGFAKLHLEMHRHSVPELPSLKERLAKRVSRITNEVPDNLREFAQSAKTAAFARLEDLPEDDKLCHGDFHPDNIIMSSRGPIIIDWSDTTKGNPAADVARTSILFSIGTPAEGRIGGWFLKLARKRALSLYLKLYLEKGTISSESIEAWRLPVAVARITEDVPGERNQLTMLVKNHLER
jgi:aminoglycoside phosphotransferase (APT) family kinase protein